MHRRLGAALAAKPFIGAIGDHLIEVHVGLGARAGLPDHQGKMIVELAVDHLTRGTDNGAGAPRINQAEFPIGLGRGKLDDAKRADDGHRHPVLADAEILPGALGLGAPIAIGGHLDRAEVVGLGARRTGAGRRRRRSHGSRGLRASRLFSRRSRRVHPIARRLRAIDYFLRKRSSRTTSAPSPGFTGSLMVSAVAETGTVEVTAEGAGTAGALVAGASLGAASAGSNCRPNWTEGAKKLLMEWKGTTSRSGIPPNDRPTSKRSSVTTRSQNWCWRMTVISSGYCASSRGDNFTPSAVDRKVMKK